MVVPRTPVTENSLLGVTPTLCACGGIEATARGVAHSFAVDAVSTLKMAVCTATGCARSVECLTVATTPIHHHNSDSCTAPFEVITRAARRPHGRIISIRRLVRELAGRGVGGVLKPATVQRWVDSYYSCHTHRKITFSIIARSYTSGRCSAATVLQRAIICDICGTTAAENARGGDVTVVPCVPPHAHTNTSHPRARTVTRATLHVPPTRTVVPLWGGVHGECGGVGGSESGGEHTCAYDER